jgi:outer membrane PBP1 activator LpoA protein
MIANLTAACSLLSQWIHQTAWHRVLPAVAIALLVAGCSAPAPIPQPPVTKGTINQPPPALPAKPEQAFDTSALESVTTTALTEGTLAAKIQRNEFLSRGLDATTLALINARLAWLDGDVARAHDLLDEASTANAEGRELLLAERQSMAHAQRQWLRAAQLAWQRIKLSKPEDIAARREEIFANLARLNVQQLRRAAMSGSDEEWSGWVTLVEAYQKGRDSVLDWIANNPAHPAIEAPPAGLSLWLTQRAPRKVAVLLPLSGRLQQAGEAVLDGLVQGMYGLYRDPTARPQLMTLDTESEADAITAYQKAVTAGADFVIGPLTREQVQTAIQAGSRPVPQLALNRPAAAFPGDAANWAALSLSPEDEAAQIAELAFGDGRRRAMIVRPATEWGQRLEAALINRWRSLGGQLIDVAEIDSQSPASTVISETLGAADSEARIEAVEEAFVAPVSARARRREDFDVLFLLAPDPATARELRPLLVFHYAGDVPVYSPASVYSGNRQARNQDLNGLNFVETPAVLEAASIDRFTRLRALGRDAVTLLDHWQQVQQSTVAPVFGETGLLQRQLDGNVQRELIPTLFDGDTIRRAPLR